MRRDRHPLWVPSLAFVTAMAVACTSPSDGGSNPTPPTYAVAPPALDLLVNQTGALQIAALNPNGDTMNIGAVIQFSSRGTAQMSVSGCDRVGESCGITALSAGVDTIGLDIGFYGRCLDGPDCTMREWNADTLIHVVATFQ